MTVVTATVKSGGTPMEPGWELLSIDICREVNRIPSAEVRLIDGDAATREFPISESGFFDPGSEIEIELRYEQDEDVPVFKGLVVRHAIEATASGSQLTVVIKDAAIKLTRLRKSAVFRDKSDADVVGSLVEGAGLTKGDLAATKPVHPELVQYRTTDWDFALSRANAHGLMVVATDGTVSLAEVDVSASPKHTFEYGISEIYELEFELDATTQSGEIESVGWDVGAQQLSAPGKAASLDLPQGDLAGAAIAKGVGFAADKLVHPAAVLDEELQAWADAAMTRSRLALITGRVSVPGFGDVALMDVAELAGISKHFTGKALVTGVRHRIDSDGWRTDVQLGLREHDMPAADEVMEAPAAGLLPAIVGLQVGVVAAFEEDPEGLHRLKVYLPGIGGDEAQTAVWARLAAADAGKERGFVFRPEVGDEVVVGCINGDPRNPVVLGSMFSATNGPPTQIAAASAENTEKGIVTAKGAAIRFVDGDKPQVFVETPGANKIAFDDDAEGVVITDQHENTVTMNGDGIAIDSKSDLTITAAGKVTISGSEVNVK